MRAWLVPRLLETPRIPPSPDKKPRGQEHSVATGFWADFRRRFSRGLAAILPTILTVGLLVWLFNIVNDHVGQRITTGAEWISRAIYAAARDVDAETARRAVHGVFASPWIDFAGFVLAIVLIYILGLFVASFIGHTIWQSTERMLMRLPLVRQIYPSIKQVTDFLLKEHGMTFQRVVAVQYPRMGIWSVGLVTNAGLRTMRAAAGVELVTIFIPSSPTPFTGYTITVPCDEVVDLPLSIEEALRFTVSGGVILPMGETVEQAQVLQATGRPAIVSTEQELTGAVQASGTEENAK